MSTVKPNDVRLTVLDMLYKSGASHLGPNMSMIEILIAIYQSIDCAKIQNHAADRPRIIISKGHAAAATYATLAHFGILPFEELATYHQPGSLLTGHVSHKVKGVEHSTGALGHGLSVGVGIALGLRAHGNNETLVFVVMGDGEIQEGSVWEAIMLANHLKLSNLIAFVDNNRLSSITKTSNVINMEPLAARFGGFGLATEEVDGHDINAIMRAITHLRQSNKASVLICNTIKGCGVSFAEGQPIWHYRTLNQELYEAAIRSLTQTEAQSK